jgi:hypothetical protein
VRGFQTIGIRHGRAWVWLVLVVVLSTALPARAQDLISSLRIPAAADPVDLAAHRITKWTAGEQSWVVLEGEAAVLRGVEGLRADRAVVRISRFRTNSGPMQRLEVYAEGHVRMTGQPKQVNPQGWLAIDSIPSPVLKPYTQRGLSDVQGILNEINLLAGTGTLAGGIPGAQPAPPDPLSSGMTPNLLGYSQQDTGGFADAGIGSSFDDSAYSFSGAANIGSVVGGEFAPAAPEPSSLLLCGTGVACLAFHARREVVKDVSAGSGAVSAVCHDEDTTQTGT